MGLLEFFCHLIDDPDYRESYIGAPLTVDRLKELRHYKLSLHQIGLVLREDKVGLMNELSAEVASLDMRTGTQLGADPISHREASAEHEFDTSALMFGNGLAAPAPADPLRAIVQWPGPVSVAVETLNPGQGPARKRQKVIVKGWHFAQQVEFEFNLRGTKRVVKPKWVHVALTGESWAAIDLSLPKKGKWTVTAANLTGDQLPSPVTTSLPDAFDAI